jgi:hypothetical protein
MSCLRPARRATRRQAESLVGNAYMRSLLCCTALRRLALLDNTLVEFREGNSAKHGTDACLPRPRSINSAGPGPVGRGVFQQPVDCQPFSMSPNTPSDKI